MSTPQFDVVIKQDGAMTLNAYPPGDRFRHVTTIYIEERELRGTFDIFVEREVVPTARQIADFLALHSVEHRIDQDAVPELLTMVRRWDEGGRP